MASSEYRREQRQVRLAGGGGRAVVTIEHLLYADGTPFLKVLVGGMRLDSNAPLSEVELKSIAESLPDVFY